MGDERFNVIGQDPRFRQMPKAERKVKIDRRFEGMFKDKKFKLKYSVDKRGRPLNATTDDNLRRFYEMSESDSDEEDGNSLEAKKKKPKSKRDLDTKSSNKAAKSKSTIKDEKSKPSKKTAKSKVSKEASKSSNDTTTLLESDVTTSKINLKKPKAKQESADCEADEEISGKKTKLRKKQQRHSSEGSETSDEEIASSSSDESLDEEEDEASPKSDQSSSSSDSESGYDESKSSIRGVDLIRGEGNEESSSSSDSSSSESEEEDEEDEELEHGWGELDKDAPREDNVTTRLAVCNMDWDRVKAQDILVLFNSFKPTGGVIKSVTIYPSEYGIERMKEEDAKGPQEIIAQGPVGDDKKNEGEGDQYHRERLRKYQLQRLKYYYAVVECDSKGTASTLYEQCDGLEYQSSSTVLDLRFIPEEMAFDHKPKDMASEMPDTALYKPVEFRTTALHQSKVELTWDETDYLREKKTMEAFGKKDFEEADVRAYLASSSGEEEENDIAGPAFEIEEDDFGGAADVDDEDQISKYRALLQGIDEKEKEEKEQRQTGLEISWQPGLKDTAEELVKKKLEAKTELTPWETYLEKKKEKNRKKREEKNQASKKTSSSDKKTDEEQAAFSDDELPDGVDMNDDFFKDSLKETENTSKGAKKKKGKKKHESLTAEEIEEQQQKKAELELLMMDEDDNKQHFNLKDIMEKEKKTNKKRKRKLKEKGESAQQDNFQIDVADPRFDAIYSSHHYSIDPSDAQYKKTKSMEALVKEKQQRRVKKDLVGRTEVERYRKQAKLAENKTGGGKKDQELSMLVKSIKNKTQQFNAKKSKKDLLKR